MTVPAFVPNDCHIVGGPHVKPESSDGQTALRSDRSVLVTTGANGGGKSVYLKCGYLFCFV